jgi:hypothetical protein
LNEALAVVSQQVVDIESGSADGRILVKASMRAMPVALVDPRFKVIVALLGVLIEAGVGPLIARNLTFKKVRIAPIG